MSRTRVHAPWWTRAPWYEPSHGLWCNRRYACNLPQRPVRHAGRRPNRVTHACTWEPIWPPYRQMHRLFGSRVPRWYIEHVWHNPERVRERDQLGKMVRQYNAEGELDDADFPNYRARHCASWYWY